MLTYEHLRLVKETGLATITINRPEVRNALDLQTWQEIRAAIRECKFDDAVRVVAITGAGGKAFASGANIGELKKKKTLDIALKGEAQETLNEIESLPKPTIAAVDGYALGGGCEVSMSCDFRVATTRAKFGLPEVGLGVIPSAGGTQRLQRLVGIAKAKELIFTGDIIDAATAQQIGLVNHVVEPDELMAAVRKLADKIIPKGPVAVSLAKMSINTGANTDLISGLIVEKLAQTVCFATQDRAEGTAAFLEKRKPNFKGE
jgi:Enoyl-CoA hydratase/carnithine racemase